MINDHVLKQAYPGFVTGKLSDFAGVFLLAMVLALVFPRVVACAAAGALFVWWKSPLSDAFIASLPWDAARVVDWTDLAALVMLPLAYRVSAAKPIVQPARAVLACLSIVAFAATSPSRVDVAIPETHELHAFDTGRTLAEFKARENRCDAVFAIARDHVDVSMTWDRFRFLGANPQATAYGTGEVVNGKVRLHFTRIHVVWESDEDADGYRIQLVKRLRRCLR